MARKRIQLKTHRCEVLAGSDVPMACADHVGHLSETMAESGHYRHRQHQFALMSRHG